MIAERILIDGVVLSVIGGMLILGSLRANRLWLDDFPADIRAAVPPKSAAERRQALAWGVPYLLVLLLIPTLSCVLLKQQEPATSFGALFIDAFGVGVLFNVFDLVVIDWLVVCLVTPKFVVIPGTEGLAGYRNFKHHVRGFGIGTIGSAAWAALVAGLVHSL